jgi:hypothetical protein
VAATDSIAHLFAGAAFPDLDPFPWELGDVGMVTSALDPPSTADSSSRNGLVLDDAASLLISAVNSDYMACNSTHDFAVSDSWPPADLILHTDYEPGGTQTPPPSKMDLQDDDELLDKNGGAETPPPCACLERALDLLKSLSASSNLLRDGTSRISLQTVLLENKQGIEAVEDTLGCRECAHDGFLLAVLAMVVLKIVERYAAASQHRGSNTINPAPSCKDRKSATLKSPPRTHEEASWHHTPGTDAENTAAAQLVLGELHRAQRVVNKLSPRLSAAPPGTTKAAARGTGCGGGVGSRDAAAADCASGWPQLNGDAICGRQGDAGWLPPLSVATLERVEIDLRKSLSSLSADIIRSLRQR